MRELGYIEGKNLVTEWRSSEGKYERLPELAAELARMKLDVLATVGTSASFAAQKATITIPIVMMGVGDPVGTGLVKNLARPGGNSTGVSLMSTELGPALLQKLHDMVPKVTRVAVYVNPTNLPFSVLFLKNVQVAAQRLGVKILPIEASTPQEIANGFAAMTRQNPGALIVPLEAFFIQQYKQIVDLATKQRLPSIGGSGEYVDAGGLMSYGQNLRENLRSAAAYVDKIFKGAKPGDIPVQQPTTFELIINRKTAKALGLTIPQSLLISATKIIE